MFALAGLLVYDYKEPPINPILKVITGWHDVAIHPPSPPPPVPKLFNPHPPGFQTHTTSFTHTKQNPVQKGASLWDPLLIFVYTVRFQGFDEVVIRKATRDGQSMLATWDTSSLRSWAPTIQWTA